MRWRRVGCVVASPDLRDLVSLTLFDRSATQILEQARAVVAAKFPQWTWREGTIEAVLLEAFAQAVAEAVFAINRVPNATTDVLLRLFGITRGLGAVPTATVTLTLADALGHEIPAGVRLRLGLAGGAVLDFTTNAAVVVPAGSSAAAGVAVSGTVNTAAANGVAAGTALTVVDAVSFVESAVLGSAVVGGVDPETEGAWRTRGVQRLQGLRTTLVHPADFTLAAIVDNVDVARAVTLDNWNVNVAANGHVTVGVLGVGGALLSAGRKTAIEAGLDANALALLAVHVVDPTITAVAVTSTVRRLAGFTDAQVQANVAAAIRAFLDPLTWPWTATVRRNELLARIDVAVGVDYVVSLDAPAADVALAGSAPLADDGVITTNVQSP